MPTKDPILSIITPVYNEEESIESCIRKVSEIMTKHLPDLAYEHIVSDNASKDKTRTILQKMSKTNPNLRVLINSRNVGPVLNIWSALKYAKGEFIIPFLPADLQDPVEVVPRFYNQIIESPDVDVIFGIRKNRKEFFLLKISRSIYYKIIRKFGGSSLPEHAGEFLITRKSLINSILETNHEYPYIRGLVSQSSSNFLTLEYDWDLRKHGISKNNYWTLLDEAINGFVSVSKIPARLALIFGFMLSFFGVIFALLNIVFAVISTETVSRGIPTIIIGIFLFGGIQLGFLGLIGEYVLSLHNQVRKSPRHTVREL